MLPMKHTTINIIFAARITGFVSYGAHAQALKIICQALKTLFHKLHSGYEAYRVFSFEAHFYLMGDVRRNCKKIQCQNNTFLHTRPWSETFYLCALVRQCFAAEVIGNGSKTSPATDLSSFQVGDCWMWLEYGHKVTLILKLHFGKNGWVFFNPPS